MRRIMCNQIVLSEEGIFDALNEYLHKRCWAQYSSSDGNKKPNVEGFTLRPARQGRGGPEIVIHCDGYTGTPDTAEGDG